MKRPQWLRQWPRAAGGATELGLLLALLATLATMVSARAAAQNVNELGQQLRDIEADTQQLGSFELRRARLRSPTHVEERLTDGELFFRLKDFVRASVIFTDIVDNYPQHSAYPDALFYLADSLFLAGDHLGARTRFRAIIDRAAEQAFKPYVQRALGRLIEIAIHIRDFEGVDAYFEHLAQLPPSEVEAATAYYRAKYLYNLAVPSQSREVALGSGVDMDGLERARVAFEAVSPRSAYYPQARYFIGVVYTLRKQYELAIAAFQRVCEMKATTDEQREVVELAQLGLGRLYYESGEPMLAADAYQTIPRTSANFDVALYEVAWTYISMGDSTRAEQALEVLAIAAPESRYIPDGQLLRGNLLLRAGRFDDSLGVFENVTERFGPIHDQMAQILARHEDPERYFRELVRENMAAFDANAFLPPAAQRWAEVGDTTKRAMATLADLAQAGQLVRETEEIVHRLTGALNAKNRVNIFSDLRLHRERTTALRNRLSSVRKRLISIDAAATRGYGSEELTKVRERRREVEGQLGGMPRNASDFQSRNATLDRGFVAQLKELSRIEVTLMGMEAKIVATERFIEDSFTETQQAVGVEAFNQELRTHRDAIDGYREAIRQLKMDVEAGRLRVGVGDQRDDRDRELRDEYAKLVVEERRILASLGGRSTPQVDAMFRRIAGASAQLDAHDARVDGVVAERVAQMEGVVGEESVKLDGYRARMTALEGDAEGVIGGIAYASFNRVKGRFYDLVLRADVGGIDVAWSVREEHRMRLEQLTRERTDALRALDAEFAEIMDDESGSAR